MCIRDRAYIAATSYKFGDYTPYLYKTEDYGKSWKLITDGINSSYYSRVVRSDEKREGLLYAGTEWGMYISFDDGDSWSKFQLNLPITSIRDLKVKDNDLVVATHGRSFWIIDDLTPLHQLNENNHDDDAILFKPDMSYRMAQSGGWNRPNNLLSGQNVKDATGTVYVVSVSGGKMYKVKPGWEQYDALRDKVGNNKQLFQVISVDGDKLSYKSYTAIGELFDAFDIIKNKDGVNLFVERKNEAL